MCGRYTLHLPDLTGLAALLGVRQMLVPNFRPRFNIAPTQLAPAAVTRRGQDGRSLELLRFGLVPPQAHLRPDAAKAPLINARVETVSALPSFRRAFAERRCVVPATGFYEWQKVAGPRKKQALWLHPRDAMPLAFAGVYEPARDDTPDGFAIVTAEASDALRAIHDRMPLILDAAGIEAWLGVAAPSPTALRALVGAAHARTLDARPVGSAVNSPRNDDPRCLEPSAASDEPREPEADAQLELF